MNFFKSVFSDEADPQHSEPEPDSPKGKEDPENTDRESSPREQSDYGSGWSFGGLMKTIATRSESVIETYRRDLQEFGSGLKKEMEVVQGSLGTVGHAVDEFGNSVIKGTAQIIAQGKDAILAADHESDSYETNGGKNYSALSSKRYSRIDAQVRAVQGDVKTYFEEPEDLDDFNAWKLGCDLDQKGEELEELFEENPDMKGIYKRIVPSRVDHDTFCFRYFYKVHKLKQAEAMRANLVKRVISLEDEEELSWDIDDDEEEDDKVVDATNEVSKVKLEEDEEMGNRDSEQKVKDEVKDTDLKSDDAPVENKEKVKDEVKDTDLKSDDAPVENKELRDKDSKTFSKEERFFEELPNKKENTSDSDDESGKEGFVSSHGDNVDLRKKSSESEPHVSTSSETKAAASGVLNKTSGVSAIPSHPSVQEEEDLGWDEIEDLSSIEDREATHSGSSVNRAELHKRLSSAEEEEDLNWEIEDDDEPVKP